MLKNWFLIASVTFGVGFGTTLLLSKDAKLGAIAGAAGLPGVVLSVAMLKRQRQAEVEAQLFTTRQTLENLQQQEVAIGQNIQQQQATYQEASLQCLEVEKQFAALEMQQQGHTASLNKLARELEAKQAIADNLDIVNAEKQANFEALESKLAGLHEQQQVASTMLLNQQEIEAEILKFTTVKAELMADIEAQNAAKTELALAIAQLEAYQIEIQDQIAEDKEICHKAEEYLQKVDLESQGKQENCQELDILIQSKSAELAQIQETLAGFQQQKIDAEDAIRNLAVELQGVSAAILTQENIKQALDEEISQLADHNLVIQQELLSDLTNVVNPEMADADSVLQNPIFELNLDESTWEQPEIKADAEFGIQDLDVNYFEMACPTPDELASNFQQFAAQPVAELADPLADAAITETLEFDILNVDIVGLDIPVEYDMPKELDIDDRIEPELACPEVLANSPAPEDFTEFDLAISDLEITYVDLETSQPTADMDLSLIGDDAEQSDLASELAETKVDAMAFDILDFDIAGLDLPSLSETMEFNLDESSLAETKPDASVEIDQLEVQWSADLTNWAESFVGNPHLEILQHIAEHGSIAHFEAAAMLNNKKVAKQFAEKVSEYSDLLPFAIAIEHSSNGNRYLKV